MYSEHDVVVFKFNKIFEVNSSDRKKYYKRKYGGDLNLIFSGKGICEEFSGVFDE